MLDLAQGVREQIIKETAPKAVAPTHFTMRTLRRMVVWAVGAAAALLLVMLSIRNELGAERLASLLQPTHAPSSRPQTADAKPNGANSSFDAQAETQRLADAVRALAAQDEQ